MRHQAEMEETVSVPSSSILDPIDYRSFLHTCVNLNVKFPFYGSGSANAQALTEVNKMLRKGVLEDIKNPGS